MLILTYCCEAANYVSLRVTVKPTERHLQTVCLVFICIDFNGLFEDETVTVTFCSHNAKPSQDLFLFFAGRMAEGDAFAV